MQNSDPEHRYYMLTVVFDATYDDGSLSSQDNEVVEARWFAHAPDNVLDLIQAEVAAWNTDT